MLKNDTVLTLRAYNVLTTQGHKIYKMTKPQFKTIDRNISYRTATSNCNNSGFDHSLLRMQKT